MLHRNSWSSLVMACVAALALCAASCDIDRDARPDPTSSEVSQSAVTAGADPRVELAQCLTEKGVVLYGAYWCGPCRIQERLFGDGAHHLNHVECYPRSGGYSERCREAGIEAFPGWVRADGQKAYGVRQLPWLAEWSGCPWEGE